MRQAGNKNDLGKRLLEAITVCINTEREAE